MGEGDIGAIGDALTGGIVARAVEPLAGESGDEANGACLNCGTPLIGSHCHRCGQPAHVHRTLAAFWHDLAHGVLHFEGKIWRTLPLLAWRPGELTRRYVEGQRARFVSPIALFLFSVFLMFAVMHAVGAPNFSSKPQTPQEQAQARAQASARLKKAEEQRAEAAAAGQEAHKLDRKIAALQRMSAPPAPAKAGADADAGGKEDSPSSGIHTDVNLGWFGAAYRKAKHNPELLIYKLQSNGYKFSWLLIPISVPFVWLLFLHRRRYRCFGAYDHTVFVTYSLSFMTLMVLTMTIVGKLLGSNDLAVMAITLIPPFHLYRQLRGAYPVSRFGAIWRAIALSFFAFVCLTLFFLLLLTMGVMD